MELVGRAKVGNSQNVHFPRIERKFQWNQYQKGLILIPRESVFRRRFLGLN